jgi:urease accessory protein
MKLATSVVLGAAATLAAGSLAAHPLQFDGGGFASGLAHPFVGLDHVVALIGVGIWAAQCGGRARVVLPLAFVGAIGIGGALAMLGVVLPAVESAIAATVLAIGLLIALAVRPPISAGASLAALFALWHGYAHGVGASGAGNPFLYAAGFVAASYLLVAAGVRAGRSIAACHLRARTVGACIVAAGALFLASA